MSICPRCGKVLCNEQALQYHLNKKVSCNSLSCKHCKSIHSSKFNKLICEKRCLKRNLFVEIPVNDGTHLPSRKRAIERLLHTSPNTKQTIHSIPWWLEMHNFTTASPHDIIYINGRNTAPITVLSREWTPRVTHPELIAVLLPPRPIVKYAQKKSLPIKTWCCFVIKSLKKLATWMKSSFKSSLIKTKKSVC